MCQQKSARHPAVPFRVPRNLNPTPLKPFAMGVLEATLRQVLCESPKALPMHGRSALLDTCSLSVATLALSLLHGREGLIVPP
ncbi:hypothetical protein, unknown function [Leishmania mexicana MHOM/GT/2001/U1103]|uniref:Uncharacterized protein n=1 Tax=Leishmania mexicana (strain MHOM/GT/2001/U1103) TaxID=929439 RepID=E9AUU3_LEIMU|nr:hypothetical protein, unknown function [Leishmania mexicana MHOM/GT/2001/U1103]CBZ26724.1 hypothetical protein, unknown function [Leishmania mexicana MHOM/GT/2001/U1103]